MIEVELYTLYLKIKTKVLSCLPFLSWFHSDCNTQPFHHRIRSEKRKSDSFWVLPLMWEKREEQAGKQSNTLSYLSQYMKREHSNGVEGDEKMTCRWGCPGWSPPRLVASWGKDEQENNIPFQPKVLRRLEPLLTIAALNTAVMPRATFLTRSLFSGTQTLKLLRIVFHKQGKQYLI